MAKLTKKQVKDLERALNSAKLAHDYIMKESTFIGMNDFKGKPYRSGQFYNESENLCISRVEKHYGSTLCQLPDAIATIEAFIINNS